MKHDCLSPEELASLRALPAGHAQRRAAESCPRCAALLRALGSFLEGDAAIPTAEMAAAEGKLAGVVAGLAARQPATARGVARLRSRGSTWGWGLGLAAGLAGLVLLAGRDADLTAGPSGVLRGSQQAAAPAPAPGVTLGVTADGALHLQWPAVDGAEAYRLELFSADLDTLAVLGPLAVPHAELAASALPAGAAAIDGALLCRVRAYAGQVEVAASALAAVGRD